MDLKLHRFFRVGVSFWLRLEGRKDAEGPRYNQPSKAIGLDSIPSPRTSSCRLCLSRSATLPFLAEENSRCMGIKTLNVGYPLRPMVQCWFQPRRGRCQLGPHGSGQRHGDPAAHLESSRAQCLGKREAVGTEKEKALRGASAQASLLPSPHRIFPLSEGFGFKGFEAVCLKL